MVKRLACSLMFFAFVATAPVWAQDTRTELIDQQIEDKSHNLQPPKREKGDRIITGLEKIFMPQPPAIRPTFGNFREDAGLAGGAAVDIPVMKTGLWTTQGAWSI